MAAVQIEIESQNGTVCRFYRNGHSKFNEKCSHSHQLETCRAFPCLDEECSKRHPPLCKYYLRFGKCKFNLKCSYLHQNPSLENANEEIESLKKEVDSLMEDHKVLNSVVSNLQEYLNNLAQNMNVTVQTSMDTHTSQSEVFKCELCSFVSKSQRGVNIHKTTIHKNFTPNNTIQSTSSVSESYQSPINCIRQSDGCDNIIYSYYNKYTAICDACLDFMDKKLKSTPFSHQLCPCCHQPSSGPPLSLCSECMDDIYDDEGYAESRWGSWHFDRKKQNIVCISLDFN